MAKHKKNVFCVSELHEFVDNICKHCLEIEDYLFAPDWWYRGQMLGHDRPRKYHKKV